MVENLPTVIFGEMIAGSFLKSAIAARGMPQFATVERKKNKKGNNIEN